jgi:hypothetical protein
MVKVTGEPGGLCEGDAETSIDSPPSDPVPDKVVGAVVVVTGLVAGVVRGGAVVEVELVVVVTRGVDVTVEDVGDVIVLDVGAVEVEDL